jgi:hypothetical protein
LLEEAEEEDRRVPRKFDFVIVGGGKKRIVSSFSLEKTMESV